MLFLNGKENKSPWTSHVRGLKRPCNDGGRPVHRWQVAVNGHVLLLVNEQNGRPLPRHHPGHTPSRPRIVVRRPMLAGVRPLR